jgi:uncharacterized membrane protein YiaA
MDTKTKGRLYRYSKIVGIFACLPILAYVLLLGASHVYISGGTANSMIGNVDANPVWQGIRSLHLPGLTHPGPIHVKRVDAIHVIRNAIFMLCTAALFALLPAFCLLIGIIATLIGLFSANWEMFGSGLLIGILLTPLSALVSVLGVVALWLGLLFQPCTPAYAILWIIVGLPLAALGALGGAAPSYQVIVIVKQ